MISSQAIVPACWLTELQDGRDDAADERDDSEHGCLRSAGVVVLVPVLG